MRPDSYKEFSPNIIWEKIIRIIYTQYGIIHDSRLIFAGSFASKRWPGIFLSPFLLQVPLAVLKRFSILTIPDNLQVTVIGDYKTAIRSSFGKLPAIHKLHQDEYGVYG